VSVKRIFQWKYTQVIAPLLLGTGFGFAFSNHFGPAYVFFFAFVAWGIGYWLTSDFLLQERKKASQLPRKKKNLTPEDIENIQRRKRINFEIKRFGVVAFVASIGIACILGTMKWEYEWHLSQNDGVITPGNDPFPNLPSSCGGVQPPANETRIYAGGNMAIVNPRVQYYLIKFGDHPLLSINTTDKGIGISGDFYTSDGIAATMDNNHFEKNPNRTFGKLQSLHRLTVRDNWKRTVLDLEYINPHAIKVSGIFYYPGYKSVYINENSITTPRGPLVRNCSTSSDYAGFIDVN